MVNRTKEWFDNEDLKILLFKKCLQENYAVDKSPIYRIRLNLKKIKTFDSDQIDQIDTKKVALKQNTFKGMDLIRNIHLSKRQVRQTHLEKNVFKLLQHLELISLANNQLTSIEPELFQQLSHLRHLDLSGNHLESLHPHSLQGLASLERLYLNSNKIARLETGLFKGLAKLQHLYLNDNSLNDCAEAFGDLEALKVLNMSGNRLGDSVRVSFKGLNHLEVLNLALNNFTAINANTFEGL